MESKWMTWDREAVGKGAGVPCDLEPAPPPSDGLTSRFPACFLKLVYFPKKVCDNHLVDHFGRHPSPPENTML